MGFVLSQQQLSNLAVDPQKVCPQCDQGYAVRDANEETRAWIEEDEFVVQEFDEERDRPFERKFKISYCPYCGKRLKKN